MKKNNMIKHSVYFLPLILFLNLETFSQTKPAYNTPAVQLPRTAPSANALRSSRRLGKHFVEDEVIVEYKPGVSVQQADSIGSAMGAHSGKHLAPGRGKQLHVLKIAPGKTVAEAVADFQKDPNVAFAQPNYIYYANTVSNDTSYSSLWGMNNTGQTVNGTAGTAGFDIGAETAWNTITDCTSTVVAVIDSGVNYNHEDLTGNMWTNPGEIAGNLADDDGNGYIDDVRGRDFVQSDNDPMDLNGHGTHVAGTIAASGNNAKGVTGVCWNAKIMPVRVLDATGSGTTANIVSGIYYANKTGAKVINVSLGGSTSDTAMSNAIGLVSDPNSSISKGVVFVAAAGNDGTSNETAHKYPSDYIHNNIISVAAMAQNGTKASYSNYGSTSVDIAAPGSNVMSSWFAILTTITDDFSTGWTYKIVSSAAGWVLNTTYYPVNTLVNPSSIYSGGTYDALSLDRVYKTFDLSSYNSAIFSGLYRINTESNVDFFRINKSVNGGDPFITGGNLLTDSGLWGSTFWYYEYDFSNCLTSTCTIGYMLDSNAINNYNGVALAYFQIDAYTNSNTAYNTIDGTSMAAPHVAGIATMMRARNPNFTYLDTIAAIYYGGVANAAFASNTSQGKHANAANALKYIPQTEGVSVTSP